jgi:hypothetical protein
LEYRRFQKRDNSGVRAAKNRHHHAGSGLKKLARAMLFIFFETETSARPGGPLQELLLKQNC